MTRRNRLKKLIEENKMDKWEDIHLLSGWDNGYYIDLIQNEEDENVEIKCINIITSDDKKLVSKLLSRYEKALGKIKQTKG